MNLTDIIRRENHIIDTVLDDPRPSYVFSDDLDLDSIVRVKNLGWLLRHAREVKHPMEGVGFSVRGWRYGSQRAGGYLSIDNFDPILLAHMNDGRTYATQWASISLLHDWLNRPNFKHYTVHWEYSSATGLYMPSTVAIGGKDYNDLPLHRSHPSRWPVAS